MATALLVLKSIGIGLACLIGFAHLLVCLVLFLPIFYHVWADDLKEGKAHFRAHWLGIAFTFRADLEEEALHHSMRIFGIPFQIKKKKPKEPGPSLTWKEKLSRLWDKITGWKKTLEKESNKAALRKIWEECKILLHHGRPRRGKARFAFAGDAPDQTGMILGLISVFPLAYASFIQWEPDFESEKSYLEGNVNLYGQFALIHLVKSIWRLIKKKHTRNMLFKLIKK